MSKSGRRVKYSCKDMTASGTGDTKELSTP
jgi:hypothetical protein